MTVIVNDTPRDVVDGTTLDALLDLLGYAGLLVAVAVNETFVPRSERGAHALRDGDRVEVVAPMAGG